MQELAPKVGPLERPRPAEMREVPGDYMKDESGVKTAVTLAFRTRLRLRVRTDEMRSQVLA